MNPFSGKTMPIDNPDNLLYRDEAIRTLKKRMKKGVQTVILGAEGVGKSSLLNSFFNRDYRIQAAKEHTLISRVTEFPVDLKEEEIYHYFADMAVTSVRILSQCGKTDEMNEIIKQCEDIRNKSSNGENRFVSTISLLHDIFGYHVVMLIDNFERFTSSKEVTIKHHDTMRKLLSCSQYIVATNSDLNKDTLPPNVSASLFLQDFGGNEIRLGGWTVDETKAFLKERLNGNNISFSEELAEKIYIVSGGIPLLLNMAADYAYKFIEANKTEEGLTFNPGLYRDERIQTLLFHWCKMLTPLQTQAVKNMINNKADGSDKKQLKVLYLRGLLDKYTYMDEYGKIWTEDDEYDFCCRFFGIFCKEEGALDKAAAQNPLFQSDGDENKEFGIADVNLEDIIQLLKEKIDSGSVNKEQMLSITQTLTRHMPGVTGTIDMNEELTDEILRSYGLNVGILNMFDARVRDFLYVGIQMDRCFENIAIPNFDFSPVYISFCKAVETHLNLTLVPIMKKVSPNVIINNRATLANWPQNRTLMLGQLFEILTRRNIGIMTPVIDDIRKYCKNNGLTKYPDSWWNNVVDTIEKIIPCRNDCPHCSILKDVRGKEMLSLLFVGSQNNPNKSFMMKCLNVHNAFSEAGLL